MTVPSRILVLAALLGAGGAAAAPAADPPARTIALLPLLGDELPPTEREALDAALRAEVEHAAVDAVQPAELTAANLASAQQVGASCAFESLSCQASLGLLTGTDRVVVGRVAPDWASDRVDLRIVDVATGTLLRETTQRLAKDPADRAIALRGAVLQLIAPERTGAIVFAADPQGDVHLDGAEIARVPIGEPLTGLAPGPHTIVVRRGGEETARLEVVVVSGEVARVPATTKAEVVPPAEIGPPLAAYAVAAGAGLAVVGGAGAGVVAAVLEVQAIEHGTRQAVRATGAGLLGAAALGVVVAGAGGVLWLMAGEP